MSKTTEPFGNIFLFSKKLDWTWWTFNKETSQVYALSSKPSKLFLLGEYPIEPFSKNADTQFKSSKTLSLFHSAVSDAEIDRVVESSLLKLTS